MSNGSAPPPRRRIRRAFIRRRSALAWIEARTAACPDGVRVLQNLLQTAEAMEQRSRGLGTDTVGALDVVRRIADEGLEIGKEAGRDPEPVQDIGRVAEHGMLAAVPQNRHGFADELEEIAVERK